MALTIPYADDDSHLRLSKQLEVKIIRGVFMATENLEVVIDALFVWCV